VGANPSIPPGELSVLSGAEAALSRGVGARLGRLLLGLTQLGLGAALGAATVYELETSALQARLLSQYAARLSYAVEPGASPEIVFPQEGPFDEQRGYSRIPEFQSRLQAQGFVVTQQARISPELARLVAWGVAPPYSEPPVTGLTIRSADGELYYAAASRDRIFDGFEDLPPILVNTLLFIENRELLDPFDARSNPVIEWDRLALAGFLYTGNKLGLPVPLQGGSTLAIQLEKYRHSPNGRTNSVPDKLRQLGAASLKAYLEGPDTRARRRQIVVDYLNTMPLAAVAGYGEVYGFGDGLRAWFGMDVTQVRDLLAAPLCSVEQVRAYKHAVALLAAVRAPTTYLVKSHAALERRVSDYTRLMAEAGVLDPAFAAAVQQAPIEFAQPVPMSAQPVSYVERKALNAVRANLMRMLAVPTLYDLDRLHLEVETTIDPTLQAQVRGLLERLADKDFVAARGLKAKRLLRTGDPSKVLYSLMLFEHTPEGNVLRVQADNLDRPFDINDGVKLELGSTAKLRTLAHYLELVTELYREWAGLDPAFIAQRALDARDPITRWAAETMVSTPDIDLESLLQAALDRKYSASPYESFFTGSGVQSFGNFDKEDNNRKPTVREAFRRSTNLVFIRLMRDLVRFHQARLPYDAQAVLNDPDNPERRRMLEDLVDEGGRRTLARAYRAYHGLPPGALVSRLLGKRANSLRHLAMVFFAWNRGADEQDLRDWLTWRLGKVPADEVQRVDRLYGNPHLLLSDYAYLLGRHPVELWAAGELLQDPTLSLAQLLDRSTEVRQRASAWLFKTRNRRAQDNRLRIRVEEDAFARMTPYWQRLGFPFERLVPSYATAIGSSSDRPAALADLIGIIVDDGVQQPSLRVTKLVFAKTTPYETTLEPAPSSGVQVMDPVVAHVLREALADVVQAGTARRVAGAFVKADGKPIMTGGKTGSGDNRFTTFYRGGGVRSSKAMSRTATFVFYIGDRYFGVMTALVPGRGAGDYEFTSALPLSVLRMAAPYINARMRADLPGLKAEAAPARARRL
jgi:membrane peptidoglycan carboxypeptidase